MKCLEISGAMLLICLLQLPLISHAQLDTARFIRQDGWIEGMENYVGLKLSINNNIQTFQVAGDNFFYDLHPNTKTIAKLDFNYRFLSFNLAFAPTFLPGNADEDMKGKTKSFGMAFGFNFPHWFHSLSYSKVKGYYLANSEDFDAFVPGGPYLQAPELIVTSFEGLTGYSFNPKFSVKSLTTQTERQLKSAGSFIPVLGYRYYIVNNKDMGASATQRSDNFEFVLGAGYYYTHVLKKFYVSLGVTPGAGYIFTIVTTRDLQHGSGDIITHSNSPVVRLNGRGALGYNGRAFFTGAIYNLTGTSFVQEGTTVINSDFHTSYQIFAGIRINAPKKLRDNVAVIDNLRKQ